MGTCTGGYVLGGGYRVVQVVAVPPTRDGCLATSLALAQPSQAQPSPSQTQPDSVAPFQPQDPARDSPSFRSLRVNIHGWGGPA